MAQMMGLSPDQLRTTAQMLGQIPPEQLQQYMMQAMQGGGGGGGGGLGSLLSGAGGGGGGGGPQVLRLSEEEMAAVDRLTEMGFDRTEAAQAFLACDKNEALAANLLMDSMGDGGAFGFGPDGGGDSGNNNNGGGNDDDENMYD
jgi:UV excision repair protein RAD23